MYIKNGENKFICIDFVATTLDKSALFYLNQEPVFTEDIIELYDNNNTVTVRDRDTMEQVKISLDELKDYILERIK